MGSDLTGAKSIDRRQRTLVVAAADAGHRRKEGDPLQQLWIRRRLRHDYDDPDAVATDAATRRASSSGASAPR